MARFKILAPLVDRRPYGNAHLLRRALDLDPAGGQRILDVGGGSGLIEAKARLAGTVIVDPQPAMLARARDKGLGLVPVLGDGARLPFRDGAFDRVLVVDALHHFAEPEAALAEMARVLADGGRLVVEEILPRSAFGYAVRCIEWLARFGSRFLEPRELKELVERTGLACKVEQWGPHAYAAVAVKGRPEPRPADRGGGPVQGRSPTGRGP